jgi:hypothetical protein
VEQLCQLPRRTLAERVDLGEMRSRARRVWEDNAIGRSLLNTETDNVVAEGFSLQMRSSSAAFNEEAETGSIGGSTRPTSPATRRRRNSSG